MNINIHKLLYLVNNGHPFPLYFRNLKEKDILYLVDLFIRVLNVMVNVDKSEYIGKIGTWLTRISFIYDKCDSLVKEHEESFLVLMVYDIAFKIWYSGEIDYKNTFVVKTDNGYKLINSIIEV